MNIQGALSLVKKDCPPGLAIIMSIVVLLIGFTTAQGFPIYIQRELVCSPKDTSKLTHDLSAAIPRTLEHFISRSKELDASVELRDRIETIHDDTDSAYFIEGTIERQPGELNVKGSVIGVAKGKIEFSIEAATAFDDDVKVAAERIAEDLLGDVITGLKKNVRIIIAPFRQLDTAEKSRYLVEAIPSMLKTSLKVSPKLILVEISDSLSYEQQREKEAHSAMYDIRTFIKLGKLLVANYVMTGDYWVADSQIRIDVRCINLATSEIVTSQGVFINENDISRLNVEMSKLAAGIRNGILRDIQQKASGTALSVVGIPPVPNTWENRIRAGYLVDGLSQKLLRILWEMRRNSQYKDKIGDLWIKQEREKIESYLSRETDVWAMAAELDVDRLVIVRYQDYNEGRIMVNAEIFDHENPGRSMASIVESGDAWHTTDVADSIVRKILRNLLGQAGDALPGSLLSEADGIQVRRLICPNDVRFSFNRIITDGSGPLEYGENSSFTFRASFPMPLRSERWRAVFKLSPVITWDWGNNTLENLFQKKSDESVHVISGFLPVVFNLLPDRGINPYAGMGFGFLWLRRIYNADFNFIHAPGQILPGYALLMGCEIKLSFKLDLDIPVKYYHTAFGQFKEEFRYGHHFNGGPLWGMNFGIGIKYDW
jgi:TolB-like protein